MTRTLSKYGDGCATIEDRFMIAWRMVMARALKISISADDVIEAVKDMKKKERETFLENLLAATAPEYLKSIKEARVDYRAGRVKSHEQVFGK